MLNEIAFIADEISRLKRLKPFQPFLLRRRSGSSLIIDDADCLAVTEQSIHVAVGGTRMTHVRLNDIESVELVTETPESRMKETILTLKHRDPFVPFNIVMNSGDRYLIENPDLLAVGRSEMAYYLPRSDRVVFIRTNQVVAVEQLEEKPAA